MSDKLPPPVNRDRPFPWRCIECKEKQVYPVQTDYTIAVKHDESQYTIHIPDLMIPTCRNCGERVFSGAEDERIFAALRAQADLLTPEEIQQRRRQLELSEEELADQLGVSAELVSRWEAGGRIQSRAMDNLLRVYFESQEVRALLRRRFRPVPIEHTRLT